MNASVQTLSQNRASTIDGSTGRSRQQPGQERWQNVGDSERMVSASAGAILLLQGLARRDLMGALIGGIGGALAYRGATGHCPAYQAAGVDTAADMNQEKVAARSRGTRGSPAGITGPRLPQRADWPRCRH